MKKHLILAALILISGCTTSAPKENYPYGMNEREWNELSIKDKARIRRDFYFYERGNINFVDPQMEVEGKKELPNVYNRPKAAQPAKPLAKDNAQ